MANFKENYHFQGSGRGPTFSRGGGGLFPIKTHITCDFPGGSGPPGSTLVKSEGRIHL